MNIVTPADRFAAETAVTTDRPTREEAEEAVRTLLRWAGDDPSREGLIDTPVFRRRDLDPGAEITGPAIIEEQTSTTVLGPGHTARVDEYLNIEIDLASGPR